MNNNKESIQYLNFFKQYLLFLVIGALTGLIAAYWINSQKPVVYDAERLFQFGYTLENAPTVEKESDQVVSVLRSPQLKEQLGLQETTVTVYKSGPFSITLQTKSADPQQAVKSLDKLTYYLSSSYQVKEIGTEIFQRENLHPERLLVLLCLAGLGGGLLLALLLSYFKTY